MLCSRANVRTTHGDSSVYECTHTFVRNVSRFPSIELERSGIVSLAPRRFQLDRCVSMNVRRVWKKCSRRCARANNEFADIYVYAIYLFLFVIAWHTRARVKASIFEPFRRKRRRIMAVNKLPGQFAGCLCSSISLLLRSFSFFFFSLYAEFYHRWNFRRHLRHTNAWWSSAVISLFSEACYDDNDDDNDDDDDDNDNNDDDNDSFQQNEVVNRSFFFLSVCRR